MKTTPTPGSNTAPPEPAPKPKPLPNHVVQLALEEWSRNRFDPGYFQRPNGKVEDRGNYSVSTLEGDVIRVQFSEDFLTPPVEWLFKPGFMFCLSE